MRRSISLVISNAAAHGIAFEDVLNSCVIDCTIKRILEGTGISLFGSDGISLLENVVIRNAVDGIFLDESTVRCAVRDNTTILNGGFGLLNDGDMSNQIFHNFSHDNTAGNFAGVSLVVTPTFGIGVLENIDETI